MTDIITTKVCTKCNEEKTIDCFYRSNQTVDGASCHCKKCHKADIKAWREQNRSIVAKKSRERYAKKTEEQKESRRKKVREWYNKNKKKYNSGRKKISDADDYSDLLPITERDIGFRSWAVITSTEYAKELAIWQNNCIVDVDDW